MTSVRINAQWSIARWLSATALLLGAAIVSSPAWALTLEVKKVNGGAIADFSYIVNENNVGDPGHADPDAHPARHPMASYSPVVAAGDENSTTIVGADGNPLPAGICGIDGIDDDPATDESCRYLISVRAPGYKLWGQHFELAGGVGDPTTLTVELIPEPLPLSKIEVQIFRDWAPLNSAPDFPLETGSLDGTTPPQAPNGSDENLAGFHVVIEDVIGEVTVDFFGDPICGTGVCLTNASGKATVPNLPFGKYEIFAIPPNGQGWVQTSTFEGKKSVGVWIEEGSPGTGFETDIDPGVTTLNFFGYTRASDLVGPPAGGATITGRARSQQAWPPFELDIGERFLGEAVENPWVALNDLDADVQVALTRGNANGNFSFNNIPPGRYQVAIWDDPLDYIIAFYTVFVDPGDGVVQMGDLGVFRWFGWVSGFVFNDANCPVGSELTNAPGCGIRNAGEAGLANVDVYLKFRDGSLDKGTFTDNTGYYEFPEALGPLAKFELLEVGFGRLERTGHSVQDEFTTNLPDDFPGTPTFTWIPPDLGGGLILNQITQQDRRSNVNWGKRAYVSGENGGIAGAVFYATTRNEFDARLAAAEDYEPGIPDVPIRMWAKGADGILGTKDDVLINEVASDHWDHPRPDEPDLAQTCDVKQADGTNFPDPTPSTPATNTPAEVATNCIEVPMLGNETKSGRWDGGWQIEESCTVTAPGALGGPVLMGPLRTNFSQPIPVPTNTNSDGIPGSEDIDNDGIPNGYDSGLLTDIAALNEASCVTLPPADYIAQVAPPPFYQIVAEEDQNTDEGSALVPLIPPPPCVGDPHLVNDPRNPFNNQTKPLCDKRRVTLANKQNPGAEFFLFTDLDANPTTKRWSGGNFNADGSKVNASVPDRTDAVQVPGRIFGVVLNDLFINSNLDALLLGEQVGTPSIPIGLKDFTLRTLTTIHTDEDGYYEVLLPSTFTAFCPIPSGVCPGMYPFVVNDPGDILDPNAGFSNAFPPSFYVRDVWPGKMTTGDTPLIPISAGACAVPPSLPHIFVVSQPYKDTSGDMALTITGTRFGLVNPTVTLDDDDGLDDPVTLAVTGYTPGGGAEDVVNVTVPGSLTPGPYQLLVKNNDPGGQVSVNGLTFHVLGTGYNPPLVHIFPSGDPNATPIQDALDAAATAPPAGELLIVHPGRYPENVVVYEQVQLQGYGPGGLEAAPAPLPPADADAFVGIAGSVIDGRFFQFSPDRPAAFEDLIASLVGNYGPAPIPSGGTITFLAKMGAYSGTLPRPRIDGLAIVNGLGFGGGGIHVHAFAQTLQISNNVVAGNLGQHGGISLGRPSGLGGLADNQNDDIRVHHNKTQGNGGRRFAGSIGIFNGAEDYEVDHNFLCANLSAEYGGGLSHFGKSVGGQIHDNNIVYNTAFDEGGGILVGGEQFPDLLGLGAGSVDITHNLIQGNLSNDDGGGIELLRPLNDEINIVNNIIVNNVATDFGGGLVLDDAANVTLVNNTIAKNKSTSTAEDARQRLIAGLIAGAGIVSEVHSAQFLALGPIDGSTFSDPVMFNNIVWDNQACRVVSGTFDCPEVIDFEVFGSPADSHSPAFTLMTQLGPAGPGNIVGAPTFVDADETVLILGLSQEGLGFINVTIDNSNGKLFGFSDYHLQDGSLGIGSGTNMHMGVAAPGDDFDHDIRPQQLAFDIGADETGFGGPPPPTPMVQLYFSTEDATAVPGVAGTPDDADIYSLNSAGAFARVFDASAVGLPSGADVDAANVVDADTIYMSFTGSVAVPTLGTVQDEDIVRFDAGTWFLFFDGSDVGLTTNDEDIDAFDILMDGSMIISTIGNVSVPGVTRADEDLVRCVGTFGPATTCTWSVYFDGSDVGLGGTNEDIDGATRIGADLLLSTWVSGFTVPGLTGENEDIFVCRSVTTGVDTACASFSLAFDMTAKGITDNVDAFQAVVIPPVTLASTGR